MGDKKGILGANDEIVTSKSTFISGLTIREAMKIKSPCVYVIRKDERLVYIGKTVNPRKRFEFYKYKNSHNDHLNNWLKLNTPTFDLFISDECNITYIETHLIKLNKPKIVNLVYGDFNNWKERENTPWFAKSGVHCPSNIILMHLRNRRLQNFKDYKAKIVALRDEFNELERVVFELDLAKTFYNKFESKIETWLSYTESKLINVLDNAA